mmetsp:Transcript_40790/g.80382  ORF Transcript_40790/g.80382 Transcript_40790/m.80382 type:complete len:290 (-) Transcript_40790:123-992(-)
MICHWPFFFSLKDVSIQFRSSVSQIRTAFYSLPVLLSCPVQGRHQQSLLRPPPRNIGPVRSHCNTATREWPKKPGMVAVDDKEGIFQSTGRHHDTRDDLATRCKGSGDEHHLAPPKGKNAGRLYHFTVVANDETAFDASKFHDRKVIVVLFENFLFCGTPEMRLSVHQPQRTAIFPRDPDCGVVDRPVKNLWKTGNDVHPRRSGDVRQDLDVRTLQRLCEVPKLRKGLWVVRSHKKLRSQYKVAVPLPCRLCALTNEVQVSLGTVPVTAQLRHQDLQWRRWWHSFCGLI